MAEFKAKDGKNVLVANKGKFALMTGAEHRASLDRVLQGRGSIAPAFRHKQAWLNEKDAAFVFTTQGVKEMVKGFRQGFAMAQGLLDPTKEEIKPVLKVLEGVEGFVNRVEADVTQLLFGFQLSAAGTNQLSLFAAFRPGSDFAQNAQKIKSPEGGVLAGLPAGPVIVAQGMVVPEGLRKAMIGFLKMSLEQSQQQLSAEQREQFLKAAEELYNIEYSAFALYSAGKEAPVFGENALGIIRTPDAKAYVASYEKFIQWMVANMPQNPNAPAPPISVRRVDVENLPVLEVTMEIGAGVPAVPKLLGPEGKLTICMAAVDAQTVVATYTPAASLPQVLQRLKAQPGGLAGREEIKAALARLPANPHYLLVLSPHRLSEWVGNVMEALPNIPKLPAFPQTQPLGIGVHIDQAGLEAELVIPNAVLENVGPYLQQLRAQPVPGSVQGPGVDNGGVGAVQPPGFVAPGAVAEQPTERSLSSPPRTRGAEQGQRLLRSGV